MRILISETYHINPLRRLRHRDIKTRFFFLILDLEIEKKAVALGSKDGGGKSRRFSVSDNEIDLCVCG